MAITTPSCWVGGRFAGPGAVRADIGVKDGRIAAIGEGFSSGDADEAIDAGGKLVFPGAVDAHYHLGIYRDITEDAESETRSSLVGGVTSVVSYFRTGQPLPGQDRSVRGDLPGGARRGRRATRTSTTATTWRRWTREQVGEMPALVEREGVTLVQVLHVLQGAEPLGRIQRRRVATP